jgi:hypothetical protein
MPMIECRHIGFVEQFLPGRIGIQTFHAAATCSELDPFVIDARILAAIRRLCCCREVGVRERTHSQGSEGHASSRHSEGIVAVERSVPKSERMHVEEPEALRARAP